MNRGIYATASGMVAAQQCLDVVSNNVANINTTGFKSDTITFNEALARQLVSGDGTDSSVGQIGIGPASQGQYTNDAVGGIALTGTPTDVAITTKQGMFAVQAPTGTRYTRDGSFKIDSTGALVTQQGYAVLDDREQPITGLGPGTVNISSTGDVSLNEKPIAKLGVYDGDFTKEGNNLWTGTSPTVEDSPQLRSSALEGSNVNPIEGMIDMIRLSRTVEMAQKSIQQQDDSTGKLITTISS